MYPGDAWGFLFANVLVQVTAVILTAWLLAHLRSRWNAAWRHGIYLVALICVLASPLLSWAMQGTGIALVKLRPPVPTAAPAVPMRIPIVRVSESNPKETPAVPQPAASHVPLEAESPGQNLQPKTTPTPSLPDILRAFAAGTLVIWLLGMALLLARWCYGLHLIAVLRRVAQPLNGEATAELLDDVRRTLGTDKLPPLAALAALDRPVMVGLIRPVVILPDDLLRTPRGPELGDILVHECAHAVCRHQVVGFLQRLAGMFFWPHPLMHLLNRELARAREEVCDNYVLRHGNAPRYARTLLELSQSLVGVSPNPAALGLFHCRWRLEDRVADLLDRRRKIMMRVNRWTTAALSAGFLLLALLIACTRVVHAEPAAGQEAASPASLPGSPNQSRSDEPQSLNQPVVQRRAVNRLVKDFPDKTDLSTPESALAAYHRVVMSLHPERWLELSAWSYGPRDVEEIKQKLEADRDEVAKMDDAYRNAEIIEVLTYRDDLAEVISKLKFPEGVGRNPYGARTFVRINGAWKNFGENRRSSLEEARKDFDRIKDNLWEGYVEVLDGIKKGKPVALRGEPANRAAPIAPGEPLGISVEKADLMGRIEWAMMHGGRDITSRKSIEWGEVQKDEKGNRKIRYKYYAIIWEKDTYIMNQVFTFDAKGNILNMENVEGFPQKKVEKPVNVGNQEGMKELVEDFFSKNFHDITSRESMEWGEITKAAGGNLSIRYKYRAKIWDKDTKIINQVFTFDPKGRFVSVRDADGLPSTK
jgi:beta-lactamase regulating signal transducer with metallopeptidase domain